MREDTEQDADILIFDLDFMLGSIRDPLEEIRTRFKIYFPEAVWDVERELYTPATMSVLFLGWLTAYVDRGAVPESVRKDYFARLRAYNKSRRTNK